jgi:hypothetical protein
MGRKAVFAVLMLSAMGFKLGSALASSGSSGFVLGNSPLATKCAYAKADVLTYPFVNVDQKAFLLKENNPNYCQSNYGSTIPFAGNWILYSSLYAYTGIPGQGNTWVLCRSLNHSWSWGNHGYVGWGALYYPSGACSSGNSWFTYSYNEAYDLDVVGGATTPLAWFAVAPTTGW